MVLRFKEEVIFGDSALLVAEWKELRATVT